MSEPAREMEVGAFDPVRVFEQTLFDLMQVVDIFEQTDSAMTPMEFLKATDAAKERLTALVTLTTTGVQASVAHKIPSEVRAQFQSEKDLEELMLTPEEKQKRLIKALRSFATFQKRPRT
jgi:hypothetical protein